MPGPLVTFAAGVVLGPEPNGLFGAAIRPLFLRGFLLLIGAVLFWDSFRLRPTAQALMRGANAAVVGVLGTALYQPVWTSVNLGPYEFGLALSLFFAAHGLEVPNVARGRTSPRLVACRLPANIVAEDRVNPDARQFDLSSKRSSR